MKGTQDGFTHSYSSNSLHKQEGKDKPRPQGAMDKLYQLRYSKASVHGEKGSKGNLSTRTFP